MNSKRIYHPEVLSGEQKQNWIAEVTYKRNKIDLNFLGEADGTYQTHHFKPNKFYQGKEDGNKFFIITNMNGEGEVVPSKVFFSRLREAYPATPDGELPDDSWRISDDLLPWVEGGT